MGSGDLERIKQVGTPGGSSWKGADLILAMYGLKRFPLSIALSKNLDWTLKFEKV